LHQVTSIYCRSDEPKWIINEPKTLNIEPLGINCEANWFNIELKWFSDEAKTFNIEPLGINIEPKTFNNEPPRFINAPKWFIIEPKTLKTVVEETHLTLKEKIVKRAIKMELQIIQNKIYEIRGQRVMLDFDLAMLYETETKRLKEAVRRNIARFPSDFMFELTSDEYYSLRTQFATLKNSGRGEHSKYLPFAFTEQGVAMLASVLKSERAIQVNIQIVRAFIALRQYALGYAELKQKLEEFMIETNMQFSDIYQVLTEMASRTVKTNESKKIGYLAIQENDGNRE
jgi:hypothetical protein